MQEKHTNKITLSGGGFRFSLQGVRDSRPAQETKQIKNHGEN